MLSTTEYNATGGMDPFGMLKLLQDMQKDKQIVSRHKCRRGVTEELFFLYWMSLNLGYSLLSTTERIAVENHIAVCPWCQQEKEERLQFFSENLVEQLDAPVDQHFHFK